MDFDYKKYSLSKLNEWMHDAISCSEATPQEIYDVIKDVVSENYYTYKNETEKCYELLALLNGNGKGHIQAYDDYVTDPKGNQVKVCDKDDPSPECQGAWNSFWNDDHTEALTYGEMVDKGYEMTGDGFWIPPQKDKVVKWQLPVQVDGLTGDCYVNFPDDLLEAANLKEGDMVEWVDNNDGSFTLRKVNGTK
jgi:hypothetical protein